MNAKNNNVYDKRVVVTSEAWVLTILRYFFVLAHAKKYLNPRFACNHDSLIIYVRKPALEEGREAFLSPDEEHRTIGAFSRIAHDCTAPGGYHRCFMQTAH